MGQFGWQMSSQPMIFPFVRSSLIFYFQCSLIHDLTLNVHFGMKISIAICRGRGTGEAAASPDFKDLQNGIC